MSDAWEKLARAIEDSVRIKLEWADIEPAYLEILKDVEKKLNQPPCYGLFLWSCDGELTLEIDASPEDFDETAGGPRLKLSDVLLSQYGECDGSTEELIVHAEKSIIEARRKLEARKADVK